MSTLGLWDPFSAVDVSVRSQTFFTVGPAESCVQRPSPSKAAENVQDITSHISSTSNKDLKTLAEAVDAMQASLHMRLSVKARRSLFNAAMEVLRQSSALKPHKFDGKTFKLVDLRHVQWIAASMFRSVASRPDPLSDHITTATGFFANTVHSFTDISTFDRVFVIEPSLVRVLSRMHC